MHPAHIFFVQPKLPKKLKPLQNMANNLYWQIDAEITTLFRQLDPMLWETTGQNPIAVLHRLREEQLIDAVNDPDYVDQLNRLWQEYQTYQNTGPNWIQQNGLKSNNFFIAFFSAEFGITENLPIYAGGLGLLAGDYLKSISDLGVPLVGVGLMYRKGYFRQLIDCHGWQREVYPKYELRDFPLELIRNSNGDPLTFELEFPNRLVKIQIWCATIGRVKLFLLDSDHHDNNEEDRDITDQLYGGDLEKRIQQEIILGIGGLKALSLLGFEPTVCHLNEGHSAFLVLERTRHFMEKFSIDFNVAKELASSSHIFTTHTPVDAGIDVFPHFLVDKYFTGFYQSLNLTRQEFLALGQLNPLNQQEQFNMAILALKHSYWANGVSRLHGKVARKMWHSCWPELSENEVPIDYITNGIHILSWIGPKMAALYDLYLGSGWRRNPADVTNWVEIDRIPDSELWQAREEEKLELLNFVHQRMAKQLKQWDINPEDSNSGFLNSRILTIGFARRFVSYKRPTLFLKNIGRLTKLLRNTKYPVQFIFAGKAHPEDEEGKKLIQQIILFSRQEQSSSRVVFLEDYDINMARYLVRGVDLWLGNPRRPFEASSTSGMKAVINGALHICTLDGWWDEAWTSETGWAIGNGEVYENYDYQDEVEVEYLYYLLEKEIIPLFYEQNTEGLPIGWISKIKKSIKAYAPLFNTHRMANEYCHKFYIPAVRHFEKLHAEEQRLAKDLVDWEKYILAYWNEVKIETVEDDIKGRKLECEDKFQIKTIISLGKLKPSDVIVEVYHGVIDSESEILTGEKEILNSYQDLGADRYLFTGAIACRQSGRYGYNLRVSPQHENLINPNLKGLLLWG